MMTSLQDQDGTLTFALRVTNEVDLIRSIEKLLVCLYLGCSVNPRAADIERHVSRVFGLRLKCDPVPTKFDTYTSYRIRASTRDTKTLLNSNKWPENVLVKDYYKVIY